MYNVMAMIGDYPLEHQPFWNEEFIDLEKAKTAARKTREHFLNDPRVTEKNFHSIVMSDEGETVNFLIDYNGVELVDDAAHDRCDELIEVSGAE